MLLFIAGVVSTLVLGVVANLLTRVYDRSLSRTSTWWRNRSEARKARFASHVEVARGDRHLQLMRAASLLMKMLTLISLLLALLIWAASTLLVNQIASKYGTLGAAPRADQIFSFACMLVSITIICIVFWAVVIQNSDMRVLNEASEKDSGLDSPKP